MEERGSGDEESCGAGEADPSPLEPDEELFFQVEALGHELEQLRLTLPEDIDEAVEAERLTQAKADQWMPWAVGYEPSSERQELTGYLEDVDIRLPLINAELFGAFERMQEMANLLADVTQAVYPRLPSRLPSRLGSSSTLSPSSGTQYRRGVVGRLMPGTPHPDVPPSPRPAWRWVLIALSAGVRSGGGASVEPGNDLL